MTACPLDAAAIEFNRDDAVMCGYDHATGVVRVWLTDAQLKSLILRASDARIALYISPPEEEH